MKKNNQENVHYYHLRYIAEKNGKRYRIPYGTVAYRYNSDGTVNRGISLCSLMDNFDKRTGKAKALGRLKQVEARLTDIEFNEYEGYDPCMPEPHTDITKLGFYKAIPNGCELY